MQLLSIYEMIRLFRKHILEIAALSVLVGLVTYVVANKLQTYTCSLGFKYNHAGAEEGLAPDGESKLDPYEIQNPLVIQGALDSLGIDTRDDSMLRGIRQNITINKVITGLDSEVSNSAALLGNKYEVPATEYEMKLTYDYSYGDEFGAKMFDAIIKQYDAFLLDKYYNMTTIVDFGKIVKETNADYIDIADIMGDQLDNIVTYLYDMASWYPDFRSKNTGYRFSDLAAMYSNLRNVEHAKYYGNIRAANLAKDPEMVIKSYQTKVKELRETHNINQRISDDYKRAITTFYDSYKAAGLYRQAESTQTTVGSSNKRDNDVLYDYDIELYQNTYDGIVLSYVDSSVRMSNASHNINYYNDIINAYMNDTVDAATKESLLRINEDILNDICARSSEYSDIANRTIAELYATKVTHDLQYLIVPEVVTDIPDKLITVFAVILAFGFLCVALLFKEFVSRFVQKQEAENGESRTVHENEKKVIDVSEMDELHKTLYEQYRKDFEEFYLVYQNMEATDEGSVPHMETFIRWRSPTLGMVSPGKIVECASDMHLFRELNEWIILNVCRDIARVGDMTGVYPVVHINCPRSELNDFTINDIIIQGLEETDIPASSICLELNGKEISAALEEIMLVKKMGIQVCVDRFETSEENNEIIAVIEPEYVKVSLDILNNDMYATDDADYQSATVEKLQYFSEIIERCHRKSIRVCICGIENKAQDRMVSQIAFDYRQGFYYSKPKELGI